MNFPIKLLLSLAQTCSDLPSYNSSSNRPAFSQHVCEGEGHNHLAEEPKTQSPSACPRSPSSVAERSKSPSHSLKKKRALRSSFPLLLLYLVLLRNSIFQQVKAKPFSSKLLKSMLWLRGPNPGICVFLTKNRILMQSVFCRRSAPL